MSHLHLSRRALSVAVVCLTIFGGSLAAGHLAVPGSSIAAASAPGLNAVAAGGPGSGSGADAANEPTPLELLADAAQRPPMEKIDPMLRSVAESNSRDTEQYVIIKSTEPVDLGAKAGFVHRFSWPAGEQFAIARVKASDLMDIASMPGVADVSAGSPNIHREVPDAPDPDVATSYAPVDPVEMRKRLDAAPAWADTQALLDEKRAVDAKVSDGAARPEGWFDVGLGHASREAWDLGYRGEGVRVGVLDTSVDFAHQDLQDTWAVNPEGSMYAGWPQVYDPYALYLYTLELDPESNNDFTGRARAGLIRFDQTSELEERDFDGDMILSACAQALVSRVNGQGANVTDFDPETCDWKVPAGISKSGTVKISFHPDVFLTSLGANPDQGILSAYAGVLLTDANEAGVYDTVYVDVDGDRDFRDEKPATKESPLSWRDIDGDGIADLSGGLLYFIADGTTPVPGSYLWGLEDSPPAAGSMIAIHYDNGGHGTLCASNVVSQGRLGVPPGVDLQFRDLPGDGKPEAVNPGMAPGAELVAVGSVYSGPGQVMESAWIYAAFGSDKDMPGDELQITSNSYGFSGTDNDGFDSASRTIDHYVRTYAPTMSTFFSTGNGGPGYGTLAPPSPAVALGVAASTQMGSTGWDSITETTQIAYGDVTSFSNRGPGADGRTGPEIATDGAYAAGAALINTITQNQSFPEGERNGAFANESWGGTSRSSPVAAGNMALIYQAFKAKNDRWPTWEEAEAIMMAGARFNGYDTFTVGAGVVDAADSVRIASGDHGVYAMPPEWTAGDYAGERYSAFAKITHPGDTVSGTITLNNPSDHPIDVDLSGQTLRRIGSYTDTLTTANWTEEETPYSFLAPDYLKIIDQSEIPEGTELMIVRGRYPLEQMDPNGDYWRGPAAGRNNWRLGVFRHTDWNDNQKLWTDKNGNGVVNNTCWGPCNGPPAAAERTHGLDLWTAVDYDQSEIEPWEYIRFSYDSGSTNNWDIPIHHPLERWGAGIYLGLWHRCTGTGDPCTGRSEAVPQTDFDFRVDFYKYEDWDWLSAADDTVTVPAGGASDVDVTLAVPEDAPYGAYQGALFADYDRGAGEDAVPEGAGYELPFLRTVIPVNANVAALFNWSGRIDLGGTAANDLDAPYDNGAVRGDGDWGWRPESGDWRFFWIDASSPQEGARWVARTTWDDVEGKTDLDTLLFGPADDRFSSPSPEENADENMYDPAWYGPYTLEQKAGSLNQNIGAGTWAYNTTSGVNEDWISGEGQAGLHEVMLHNVLFSGHQFEVPFDTTVASAWLSPSSALVREGACTEVTLTTGIELPGFSVEAYGLAKPEIWNDYPIPQDDPNDPSTASFTQTLTVDETDIQLSVDVTGADDADLDLFVVRDINEDGQFTTQEVVASSTTSTANESVRIWKPVTGTYQVWVQGWQVPGDTTPANIKIELLGGDRVYVESDGGDIVPDEPNVFRVCLREGDPVEPNEEGLLIMGPEAAPGLFQVQVHTIASSIYLPISKRESMDEPAQP